MGLGVEEASELKRGPGNILFLNCSGGYITLQVCQNSRLAHLKGNFYYTQTNQPY